MAQAAPRVDSAGDSLHKAAQDGNTELVERLLKEGANPNVTKVGGVRPLHLAALRGNTDVARLLIASGAEIEARDLSGGRPIHSAAYGGNLDIIKLLLDRRVDIGAGDTHGYTPLHCATEVGHVDIVELLIASGAEMEARDLSSGRPIHFAAYGGNLAIIKLLLDRRVDIGARDTHGYTPLHKAAQEGHADVVQLLIEHKAAIDVTNRWGDTPLHLAAQEGHADVAELLLEHGANPNIIDLYLTNISPNILAMLLEAGATLNAEQIAAAISSEHISPDSKQLIVLAKEVEAGSTESMAKLLRAESQAEPAAGSSRATSITNHGSGAITKYILSLARKVLAEHPDLFQTRLLPVIDAAVTKDNGHGVLKDKIATAMAKLFKAAFSAKDPTSVASALSLVDHLAKLDTKLAELLTEDGNSVIKHLVDLHVVAMKPAAEGGADAASDPAQTDITALSKILQLLHDNHCLGDALTSAIGFHIAQLIAGRTTERDASGADLREKAALMMLCCNVTTIEQETGSIQVTNPILRHVIDAIAGDRAHARDNLNLIAKAINEALSLGIGFPAHNFVNTILENPTLPLGDKVEFARALCKSHVSDLKQILEGWVAEHLTTTSPSSYIQHLVDAMPESQRDKLFKAIEAARVAINDALTDVDTALTATELDMLNGIVPAQVDDAAGGADITTDHTAAAAASDGGSEISEQHMDEKARSGRGVKRNHDDRDDSNTEEAPASVIIITDATHSIDNPLGHVDVSASGVTPHSIADT